VRNLLTSLISAVVQTARTYKSVSQQSNCWHFRWSVDDGITVITIMVVRPFATNYRTQWTAEVLFLAPSGCFCVWTDLHQVHTEDVFGPSLRRVWRSRSKVKSQVHQRQKRHFSALSEACVRFMFGRTSLASSFPQFDVRSLNAS